MPIAAAPTDIEDPLAVEGWKPLPVDEERVHTAVLRELCSSALPLIIGGAGHPHVAATLQTVDEVNRQLVFGSAADGIAVARAVLPLPLWAAAHLHNMRVQFTLHPATCRRDGERFSVHTGWPHEVWCVPRRRAPRFARAARRAPVVRLHAGSQLTAARSFAVLDLSEQGCAMLLPHGMAPPEPGSTLRRIELELDDEHIIFTDARVQHVSALRHGTHRVGCRWEGMHPAGMHTLARWLSLAARPELSAVGH